MPRKLIINGQIYLYGDVGLPPDLEGGFDARDVAESLAELGPANVTVHVNSGGGIAHEGMTIYSLFAAHPGQVTMVVDGVAASAASLLVMAGDEIEMRVGTMLMIHDPSGITIGPATKHADMAASLNKLADNYAAVYAERSGKDSKSVRDMMLKTTWFDAEEALAQGFASRVVMAKSVPMAQFEYHKYGAVPPNLQACVRKPMVATAAIAARMRMAAAARR